jgi:Ca2+-binding EF-hand superfamily protein
MLFSQHLYKRFRKLDRSHFGTISKEELLALPELAMNPLNSRVCVVFRFSAVYPSSTLVFVKILALFQTNEDDRIDFRSFVACMHVLCKGTREEKLYGSRILFLILLFFISLQLLSKSTI